MAIDLVLYIVAFVLFLLAGFNVPFRGIRWEWLGVAAFVATFIF